MTWRQKCTFVKDGQKIHGFELAEALHILNKARSGISNLVAYVVHDLLSRPPFKILTCSDSVHSFWNYDVMPFQVSMLLQCIASIVLERQEHR